MKLSSFFIPIFLIAAASLGFANQLPNITGLALPTPSASASENPIELLSSLSPQCQAALFSIVTPEFLQCVPIGALLPLLTDPTLLPSVLADPVANAPKLLPIFDAICAAPKCSDEGVQTALKNVKEGCAADAENPLIQLAIVVMTFYSPGRDIICFKDNKDNFCLVDLVTTVLTLPPPPKDFHLLGGIVDELIVAEPKFICTPCDKAILNTLVNFLKKSPDAVKLLEQAFHVGPEELFVGKLYFFLKCGFQFLDGKVPDPSKIDPSKFSYQQSESGTSLATQNDVNLFMIGSLLASTLVLN